MANANSSKSGSKATAPNAVSNKRLEPGALATDSEEIAMRVQACQRLFSQMVADNEIKPDGEFVGIALLSLLDRVTDETRALSDKLYAVLRAANAKGGAQ